MACWLPLSFEFILSVIFISTVTGIILFIACLIAWFYFCNQNAMQRSIEKFQFQIILIAVFAFCIVSSIVAMVGLSLIHTGFVRMRTKSLDPTVQHVDGIINKLHLIREKLGPVDGYIASLRPAIQFLQKFGLSLEYVSNIIDQVQNGKNRFVQIVYDTENKFAKIKDKAQAGLNASDAITTFIGVISWLIILVIVVGVLLTEQFKEMLDEDELLHQIREIVVSLKNVIYMANGYGEWNSLSADLFFERCNLGFFKTRVKRHYLGVNTDVMKVK